MKTKTQFKWAAILMGFIGFTALGGCSKIENQLQIVDENHGIYDLKKLNDFEHSSKDISNVFHTFRNEMMKRSEINYKSTNTINDRQIDEAIWLIEASLNFDWAFRMDSIEELIIDTVLIQLTNINFTTNGIPIIDGNELLQVYNDLDNAILVNKENGLIFWVTRLEITEIGADKTDVMVINTGGQKSSDLGRIITPLPPGTYIPPFPGGHWNYAGSASVSMAYAELDFWNKIRAPGNFYLGPGYTAIYKYTFYKSAYLGAGQAENRLLWDFGKCNSYVLNTQMMNQYLYSSKDLIDEYNPFPTYLIGFFRFNCWEYAQYTPYPGGQSSPLPWFQHAVTFDVYEVVYVGLPD